jgi:hypothetical protein
MLIVVKLGGAEHIFPAVKVSRLFAFLSAPRCRQRDLHVGRRRLHDAAFAAAARFAASANWQP